MHTINPRRTDTGAFVFIDHPPWVALPVPSIDGRGGPLDDPLFTRIAEVVPGRAPGMGAGLGPAVQHHGARLAAR